MLTALQQFANEKRLDVKGITVVGIVSPGRLLTIYSTLALLTIIGFNVTLFSLTSIGGYLSVLEKSRLLEVPRHIEGLRNMQSLLKAIWELKVRNLLWH